MRIAPAGFALAACVFASAAQAQQAKDSPTNDAPNSYKTIEGWAKLPAGRVWGSTSSVDVDQDGTSIWVGERCGTNSCIGSQLDPVLKFDKDGNLVRGLGAGMIQSPHGIHVDHDGNIWIVDCSCTAGGGGGRGGRGGRGAGAPAAAEPIRTVPPPATAGHQIYKFSPAGTLLLTLGKAGGGRDAEFFTTPNDVLVAPNGEIWVVEGHSSQQGTSPARVVKFDKNGNFVKAWGTVVDSTKKDEPYAFDQPHAIAMDSKGRLFVGDRGYNRIKIFDQQMKLLDTWYQFSRPSGIWIDKADNIYVADSESGSVNPAHWAWKRGIRIGKIADGKVATFIPDPAPLCASRLPAGAPASAGSTEPGCASNTSAAEGVAVDKNGVIYGAEVGPRALKRYVKQ
jgi:DNA-binding beta-propeller fold protein YncE